MTKGFLWLLLFGTILLISGIYLYFSHFHFGFSLASTDWANFATFIGLFLGCCNLIFLFSIAYFTLQTTKQFNLRQLRPHIYLTQAETIASHWRRGYIWSMTNRSSVPAANVLVRFNLDDKWSKWIVCFSLGQNLTVELDWVFWPGIIEICYADIENTRFFTYEMRQYTGKDAVITKEKYEANLREAQNAHYRKNLGHLINANNLTDRLIVLTKRQITTDKEVEAAIKEFLIKEIF